MAFVWVFLGGGLGSVFRFSLSKWIPYTEGNFPYATLMANIISSIILGMALGWAMKQGMSAQHKLFLMTGFCGGFSTFSTFSGEGFYLMERGDWITAISYILISIVLGLASIYLGIKITGS
jgi:CrcB protein